MAPEHDLPFEEYHRAGREITNGNPEVDKSLFSRRDDVTLANPFGPPARGWIEVSATLDRAAQNNRDGEVVGFENISTVVTADLAYTVEIESYRARVEELDTYFRCRFFVAHPRLMPILVGSDARSLKRRNSALCPVG